MRTPFACVVVGAGGYVYDMPVNTLRHHLTCSRLRNKEYTFGIHIHDLVPICLTHLKELMTWIDSRIIHYNINSSPR